MPPLPRSRSPRPRPQEEYKRQDAGVTHKHHNAGVAAVLQYYSQVEDDEEDSMQQ